MCGFTHTSEGLFSSLGLHHSCLTVNIDEDVSCAPARVLAFMGGLRGLSRQERIRR